MLHVLAALVAGAAGVWIGRRSVLVQLASWFTRHPTPTLIMRAALDHDAREANILRIVNAALETGERLWIVPASQTDGAAFCREHNLTPDQVRLVTDPRQVRGTNVSYWLTTPAAEGTRHAEAIADHLSRQVFARHADRLV